MIAQKYTEWKMSAQSLICWSEMVSACIKEIFKKDDIAVSSHRAHAHYIGKGGDLKK